MQTCGAIAFSTAVIAESSTETPTDDYTKDWSENIENKDTETGFSAIQLDALAVKGRALSSYKEDETTLGTRTNTPIDETPQSIQVLTEDLIEDQAARQISDLYRSVSGLSYNNFSTVTLRGFSQDEILYDGMKGNPFSDFSIPQLFNIEQVQVLKGPSGALYGAGEPGGVINYVTKKPTYEQKNTIEVSAGNKDFLSGSIESSGPANESGSQRYRVGIYSDGEDSYRNNVEEENRIIDLGYAWDFNDDNTLTIQYTNIYQYITGARIRGIPTDDDGNFLADTSWNNNESSDFQKLEAQVFQAKYEHSFNNWLDSNVTTRYFENTETQKYHELNALLDTDGDGTYDSTKRQYRDRTEKTKGLSLEGNLILELGHHTLVVGSEYYHEVNDLLYYRATGEADGVSNLSLTDPVYGQDNVSDYNTTLYSDENTVLNRGGVYIQDQWKITEKLSFLSSGRLNYTEEDFTDNKAGTSTSYNELGYSTRFGLTYEINEQFKPYISYSTGFSPQSAEDQADSEDGSLFDPEESEQIEVGLRSYLFNNKLNLNIAAYHIVRKNILQEDADDDDYLVSIGKIRSQGIEIDALVDLTSRWAANLSYAYNDVKVTDADDGVYFANTPHQQLGLWTRYDFPSITSSIGFGADYVSQQKNRNNQTVKAYTVYDASWQTNWNDWKFQVNIKNLFDKKYAISGFTETIGSYVGERRRIYLTASYDF